MRCMLGDVPFVFILLGSDSSTCCVMLQGHLLTLVLVMGVRRRKNVVVLCGCRLLFSVVSLGLRVITCFPDLYFVMFVFLGTHYWFFVDSQDSGNQIVQSTSLQISVLVATELGSRAVEHFVYR